MNRLKKSILAFGMSVIVGGSLFATLGSNSVSAVAIVQGSPVSDCSQGFLTFPTWFRGLVKVGETVPGTYECVIESPNDVGGLGPFITHIALNVIEIGMQIAGYLAAGFILYGGFMFLTSQGAPDATVKARQTILNAVIGLIVSIIAVAAINFISVILIH
jgi:hypothetical protein